MIARDKSEVKQKDGFRRLFYILDFIVIISSTQYVHLCRGLHRFVISRRKNPLPRRSARKLHGRSRVEISLSLLEFFRGGAQKKNCKGKFL